ncbi:alpha/beta fold hydrolase [Legionella sp. D16C41]|uniref:alpha/beta fold hydrolase n=1 Tax=Legionella sp. D16C41 TaxID=3402688 RepID=UPI003AF6241D
MPKIKINDISLYYETHGQGEPIIFIAGFSVDHTVWQDVLTYLQDDYQLILLDNRGAGQTDAPNTAYTIKQMADDVVALCDKLGFSKVYVVGNSMGGCIVQTLAYHYPDLLQSAVISNSVMTLNTPYQFYLAAQLELLRAQAPIIPVLRSSLSWVFSYQFLSKPGKFDELIELALNNPYPFTLAGYEGQYAALTHFDASAWAKNIKVPTLVLGSEQDLIFNEATVKLLAQQIPNAHYFCFKECGHVPYLEYPEQFAQVIKNFFNS